MRKRLILLLALSVAGCTTATSNLATASSPSDLPGYSQPYDRVFGAAVDAVSMLSWEITLVQKDAGVISARTPMSLTTYGDKITIRLFQPDSLRADSLTRVGFTSGTNQAFDWGKNSRNQTKFLEKLNAILQAK